MLPLNMEDQIIWILGFFSLYQLTASCLMQSFQCWSAFLSESPFPSIWDPFLYGTRQHQSAISQLCHLIHVIFLCTTTSLTISSHPAEAAIYRYISNQYNMMYKKPMMVQSCTERISVCFHYNFFVYYNSNWLDTPVLCSGSWLVLNWGEGGLNLGK